MNSVAMLKPRKQTNLEIALVALTKRRKLLTAAVWAPREQQPAAVIRLSSVRYCSTERAPISPSFPRRFSHLVVSEIPTPEIENVFFQSPLAKPQAGCEFMKNARIAHRTW
jgi:hypothetical protein